MSSERDFWEKASRENPLHYIATSRTDWKEDEFLADGAWRVSKWVIPWLMQSSIDIARCRFLEIGCGAGRFAYHLAPLVGMYVGVDIAPQHLELARKFLLGRGKICLIRGNGLDLSMIQSGTFDAVFSYAVLQHIYSKITILNYIDESIRVLRPGGGRETSTGWYQLHFGFTYQMAENFSKRSH